MVGKGRITRRSLVIAGATLGAPPKLAAQDRSVETVEIADSETATIDGRIWDKPMVGGKTVDAVHRSVLLRFPAMAEPIAARLAKGFDIARAELVLAYRVSGDAYEWAMPTGGHGLRFASPRLAIIYRPLAEGNSVSRRAAALLVAR